MIQIRSIATILLLLSHLALHCQSRFAMNNISLIPMFYGERIKDSLSGNYNTKYIGVIKIMLERKIYKETFINFTPNYSFVSGNTIQNGHGFGYELGVRKYWNIEIYNKMCKPILRKRLLLSSKVTFINNSYYFDENKGTFTYKDKLTDYGVNLYPLCIDLRIFKIIYFSYQYNILMAKYSQLKNHNIGFSFLFN